MQSVLIVNTAATTYDLTTLAAVKSELNLVTTAEDAKLSTWISQASNACASYCDRVFGQETVTETFRQKFSYPLRSSQQTRGLETMLLTRTPVSAIVSITQDGTLLTQDVDYQLDPAEGILYRLDSTTDTLMSWYFGKLTVNYTGGYALVGSLPHNIERACISTVVSFRAASGRDSTVKQESIPGVLETQYWVGGIGDNGTLTPDVTALLDPFRNIGV
jgi:hypothetical protein